MSASGLRPFLALATCLGLVVLASAAPAEEWSPESPSLLTRWGRDLRPAEAWNVYPRPQMKRPQWRKLNGLWDYAIRPRGDSRPDTYDGKILVPFPVESALSGVNESVTPGECVWYRRTFDIPDNWDADRLMLRFEACDWKTTVWVNGDKLGTHEGGFDHFAFDLSDHLQGSGPQELVVRVWDPTKSRSQPRGKQVPNPRETGGNKFTAVTGIWQTVWLEPVSEPFVRELDMVSDIDEGTLTVTTNLAGPGKDVAVRLTALAGGERKATARGAPGEPVEISINNPRLWSPQNPFLYDLRVELRKDGQTVDRVTSYFGMREVGLGKDEQGRTCITLNGEPREVNEGITAAELVAELALTDRRIAMEVNEELLPRSQFEAYRFDHGDRVEIVHAIGGG